MTSCKALHVSVAGLIRGKKPKGTHSGNCLLTPENIRFCGSVAGFLGNCMIDAKDTPDLALNAIKYCGTKVIDVLDKDTKDAINYEERSRKSLAFLLNACIITEEGKIVWLKSKSKKKESSK